MYAGRNPPDKPPCESCKVNLLEENQDAGKIFQICRGQIITAGMGDIIDINILAVKAVMDIEGIQNQKVCLQKVLTMFHYWQQNRKSKDESSKLESE